MCIRLIKPTLEYARDIMEYKSEFLSAGDSMDGCGNLRECSTAKQWIDTITLFGDESTCPPDKVVSSLYIAVRSSDNKIVGVIDFRHHINHPILSLWGGHIGYSVRPSERRRGYAREMLRQNLENCRKHGLSRVLVTCDSENIASEKTIIANGGCFEKTVDVDGKTKKRYWIELVR